jgi:hypothetical protein
MQNHTHTDYSHHWYIRTRLQCGHIFMTRYAKSHTHIDLARRSILLVGRRSCCTWSLNKLHFCWWLRELIPGLQWDHKAMIIGHRMNSVRFATLILVCKSSSVMKKLQQTFRRLVHPDAKRFCATFPGHSCEQGVCHKNSSGSCVRGMSNPITHITRILLATERSRRKKREKQKLAPYKIYSLHHS